MTFLDSGYAMGSSGPERLHVEQAAILECSGCRQRVVVIEEQWLDDHRAVEALAVAG